MIELDIVKLNKQCVCVGIKSMTQDQWKVFKKEKGFFYRAYQKGFQQHTIGI